MNSSFKILFFSLLFIFGATAVQAQTSTDQPEARKEWKQRGERGERGNRADLTPAQMADKQTERLAKQVTLTDKQLDKVKAVNLEYANKLVALKGQTSEDREQNRTAHKALRAEQEAAINKVLTKEQVAELEAHKAEMKAKRGERKGGKKGKGGKDRGQRRR